MSGICVVFCFGQIQGNCHFARWEDIIKIDLGGRGWSTRFGGLE